MSKTTTPKQHTKPCKECPFRRESAPGYLGHNTLDDFAMLAMSERHTPCHMTVNYRDPAWEFKQDKAPQCVGRATMWANTCKMPRDPQLLRAAPDKTVVFSSLAEFTAHHGELARTLEEWDQIEQNHTFPQKTPPLT